MLAPVAIATWIHLCIPWADPAVATALVTAGSAGNPYLISDANGNAAPAATLPQALEELRAGNPAAERYLGLTQLPVSQLRALGLPPEIALEPCANLTLGWQVWEAAQAFARSRQSTPAKTLSQAFSWYRTRQDMLETPFSKKATELVLSHRPTSPAPFGSRLYNEIAAAAANGRALLLRLDSPGSLLGRSAAIAIQTRTLTP